LETHSEKRKKIPDKRKRKKGSMAKALSNLVPTQQEGR